MVFTLLDAQNNSSFAQGVQERTETSLALAPGLEQLQSLCAVAPGPAELLFAVLGVCRRLQPCTTRLGRFCWQINTP